jgi:DNA-binding protein HU-beta
MNKEQLVAATARKTKESEGDVKNYAKWEIALLAPRIFATILDTLSSEEDVQIQGFGRFSIKTQKARNAINPNTKERIRIPEKKKIVFYPTPSFKFNSKPENGGNSDTTEENR